MQIVVISNAFDLSVVLVRKEKLESTLVVWWTYDCIIETPESIYQDRQCFRERSLTAAEPPSIQKMYC